METGRPRVVYGNVRNDALIDNLPDGCVEVACLVDTRGVRTAGLSFAAAGALALMIALLYPQLAQTGLLRLAHPFGGYDWPRHAGATYFLAQTYGLSHEPAYGIAALRAAALLRDQAVSTCGDVKCIGKPNEDPHYIQAKPSFIVTLNNADVLVENGLELEIGWLPALIDQTRNSKIRTGAPGLVVAAEGVPLGPRAIVEVAVRVHFIVAQKLEDIAVQLIGPALDRHDHARAADVTVFAAAVAGDHLYFFEGVDVGLVAQRADREP